MKILITGSNGFLGSVIYRKLKEKKYKTKKLIFKEICKKKNNKIKKILDKEFFNYKPDIIIHCATFFTKSNSNFSKKNTLKINFTVPSMLLDVSNKYSISKFINIGTAHEFEKNSGKFYPYLTAKKKFTNELIKNKGDFDIHSIYIFNTFGQNDKRKKLLNIIINKKKDKNIKVYDNLKINFLNVETIANFVLKSLKTKQLKNIKLDCLANKKYFNTSMLKLLDVNKINFIKKIPTETIFDHQIKLPFKKIFFDQKVDDALNYIKHNIKRKN